MCTLGISCNNARRDGMCSAVRGDLGRGRSNAAHPTFESLDAFFCECLERVEAAYAALDKAYKIRVERWISKLNGPYPSPSIPWRKNRNDFASLLARAVEEVDFREPFDRRPPEGSLPTLAPYLRTRIPDRSPSRRTGRGFWEQQRARLRGNHGHSGRTFAKVAADASRTFQSRHPHPQHSHPHHHHRHPQHYQNHHHHPQHPNFPRGENAYYERDDTTATPTAPPSPTRLYSPRHQNKNKNKNHTQNQNQNQNQNHNNSKNKSKKNLSARGGGGAECCSEWKEGGSCGGLGLDDRDEEFFGEKAGRGGGGGGLMPPPLRPSVGGGERGEVEEGCERCGGDPAAKIWTLQATVKDQALQIGALRIHQEFRGRGQEAEFARLKHAQMLERNKGQQRLRHNQLEAVRLDELLAKRGEEATTVNREEGSSGRSQTPRSRLIQATDAAAATAVVDPDLDRRLERFQEDARVLVEAAKHKQYKTVDSSRHHLYMP